MKTLLRKFTRTSVCLTLALATMVSAAPQVIELSKGDKSIAVFGTIHVTRADWLPLPQTVMQQLSNADALAVELDLSDQNTMAETNRYMVTFGMSPDRNVATVADEKAIAQLNTLLGPMASGMMQMRPWIVAVTVTMLRAKQSGLSGEAVDMVLVNAMKKQQKPVVALESVAEQFSAFEGLTVDEEKAFLDSALSEEMFDEEMQMTIDVWQHQNVQAANTLLGTFEAEMPDLFQKLFIARNHLMVQRIVELNDQYPKLFMAVGALHLYGDEGVIELLKKAGYQ